MSARVRRFALAAAGGLGVITVAVALSSRDPRRAPADRPTPSAAAIQPAAGTSTAQHDAVSGSKVPASQPGSLTSVPTKPFAVALDGEALVLTNNTGAPATGFSLILLGRAGSRHQAVAADETVDAGGTLTVPFAFFEPPPGQGMRLRQVDLTVARSRTGRLALSVPLQ